MTDIALYYSTFESPTEAQCLITALLSKKLILCANVFPIVSWYHWEGAINESSELACYLKVLPQETIEFERYFLEQHPYRVPCLIRIDASSQSPNFVNSLLFL